MTDIDLDALEAQAKAQLVQCGPCDFGLVEYGCTCPKGDPRWVISQLVEVIAEVRQLREQRDRVLCGACEADAIYAVDPDQIREVYAADQPCPAGCPHPYRSHGPDGCRVRVGKCDVCACQEPGSAQPANLEAQK